MNTHVITYVLAAFLVAAAIQQQGPICRPVAGNKLVHDATAGANELIFRSLA